MSEKKKEIAKQIMDILPSLGKVRNVEMINRISKGEYLILGYLHHSRDGMISSDISKEANISLARASVTIDSLEKKGYVKRNSVEGDRRKMKVILTESGYELISEFHNNMLERMEAYLEYLGDEDAENLLNITMKSYEYIKTKKENSGV